MALLYIRQRLNVQLNASHDYPHGRVVELGPREPTDSPWIEVDDKDEELLAHPIIVNLMADKIDGKRRQALRDAEIERDEAIAKANGDYAKTVGKINADIAEERAKEAEAWQKRADKAAEDRVMFVEPHPDPAVRTELARTGGPGAATPTAVLRQEPFPAAQPPARPVARRDAPGAQATDSDGTRAGTRGG